MLCLSKIMAIICQLNYIAQTVCRTYFDGCSNRKENEKNTSNTHTHKCAHIMQMTVSLFIATVYSSPTTVYPLCVNIHYPYYNSYIHQSEKKYSCWNGIGRKRKRDENKTKNTIVGLMNLSSRFLAACSFFHLSFSDFVSTSVRVGQIISQVNTNFTIISNWK